MWENYNTDLKDSGTPTNFDAFKVWAKRQSEIHSATSRESDFLNTPQEKPKNLKTN